MTIELPLFALNTVLYPGGRLPLKVFEQRYQDMTKACLRDQTCFGVCLIREGSEVGAAASTVSVGCTARIEQWDMPHPNFFHLLCVGEQRFRLLSSVVAPNGLIRGQAELLPHASATQSMDPLCQRLLREAIERVGAGQFPQPVLLDDPDWVSYRLAEILPLERVDRQALLEMDDASTRLAALRDALNRAGVA